MDRSDQSVHVMHGFLLQIATLCGPRCKANCIVQDFTYGHSNKKKKKITHSNELCSQGGMKPHPSLKLTFPPLTSLIDLDSWLVLVRGPRPPPLAQKRVIVVKSRWGFGRFSWSRNMSVDVNWAFTITTAFTVSSHLNTFFEFGETTKEPSLQWPSPEQENRVFPHNLRNFLHFSQWMLWDPLHSIDPSFPFLKKKRLKMRHFVISVAENRSGWLPVYWWPIKHVACSVARVTWFK